MHWGSVACVSGLGVAGQARLPPLASKAHHPGEGGLLVWPFPEPLFSFCDGIRG